MDKIQKNRPVLLNIGGVILFKDYIAWLANIIPCYIIANKLEQAESLLIYAMGCIDESERVYDKQIIAEIHYMYFYLQVKKKARQEIMQALQEQASGSKVEEKKYENKELVRLMKYHLDMAVSNGHGIAKMVSVIIYIDPLNGYFDFDPRRSLKILDDVINELLEKRSLTKEKLSPYLQIIFILS